MPTLYIAGAGCSRGTLAGSNLCPPVAAEFVKMLRGQPWFNDYKELPKVIDYLDRTNQHVGLEELWTCIDIHAKFPAMFPIPWSPRGDVVPELKSALLRTYGKQCDTLSRQIMTTADCTVVELARQMQPADTVVSFNYDTMLERVVKNIAGTSLCHGKDLKYPTIRFAKPHGSTSWKLRELADAVTNGEPIVDSIVDHGAWRDWDPLLLGAVPLKSELLFELQEYYSSRRIFDVISEQWQAVSNAIATATNIVLLGYSLPKEDLYGRFFLREGVAMRESSLPKPTIAYYSLAKDCDSIGRSIRECFPMAAEICYRGVVTEAPLFEEPG